MRPLLLRRLTMAGQRDKVGGGRTGDRRLTRQQWRRRGSGRLSQPQTWRAGGATRELVRNLRPRDDGPRQTVPFLSHTVYPAFTGALAAPQDEGGVHSRLGSRVGPAAGWLVASLQSHSPPCIQAAAPPSRGPHRCGAGPTRRVDAPHPHGSLSC